MITHFKFISLISLIFALSITGLLVAQEIIVEDSSGVGLSTPRRSLAGFLDASRKRDYEAAATFITPDLRGSRILRNRQRADLAQHLFFVLEHSTNIELDSIEDTATGNLEDGIQTENFASIKTALNQNSLNFTLHRRWYKGQHIWFISQSTLQISERLYPRLGGPLLKYLPAWTRYSVAAGFEIWQIAGFFIALCMSLVLGSLIALPLFLIWKRVAKRTRFTWDERLLHSLRKPIILLVSHVVMLTVLNWLYLPLVPGRIVHGVILSTMILVFAWFFTRFINTIAFDIHDRLASNTEVDEWQHRSARTQLIVLRRVFNILIWFIAAALILTRFEILRDVGMSLLASAGVAGVVLGFAAQKSIANLLAGIQLALTQPMRIGDTVIIEDEFGIVEEIHLTYIVLKIWDLRRLVVPIQKILDESFQNWTRNEHDLLGTVYFFVDHATPVQSMRDEFVQFVQSHSDWDGSVCTLIVHEVQEQSMQIRGLVSATDAGKAFALRCAVREHMMKFLRNWEGGQYLPHVRIDSNSKTING